MTTPTIRVRHIGGGLLALYRGDELLREIGVTPDWDFRDRDEFIARYNAAHPDPQPQGAGEDWVMVPRRAIELLAALEVRDEHDDNGPGEVVCPCCNERARMCWYEGNRVTSKEQIPHDADCPLINAAKWLASPPPEPLDETFRKAYEPDDFVAAPMEYTPPPEPVSEGVTDAKYDKPSAWELENRVAIALYEASTQAPRKPWSHLSDAAWLRWNGYAKTAIKAADVPALIAECDGLKADLSHRNAMCERHEAALQRAEAERDELKNELIEAKRIGRQSEKVVIALHRDATEYRQHAERALKFAEATEAKSRAFRNRLVSALTEQADGDYELRIAEAESRVNEFEAAIDAARKEKSP